MNKKSRYISDIGITILAAACASSLLTILIFYILDFAGAKSVPYEVVNIPVSILLGIAAGFRFRSLHRQYKNS